MEWQPIESAPKDGTIVDLWFPSGANSADRRCPACLWEEGRGWVDYVTDETLDLIFTDDPTHWMPLPEPPK